MSGAEPVEIPDGPVIPPDLGEPPADGSRLPKAGERIDDDLDYFLGTEDFLAGPALLPEGGRSLVAPAMLIDCNSGLIAVMEVPGTPAEAVRSFEPQKVDRYPEFLFQGTTDDVDWAQFMYDSAGGFYLLTTVVATITERASSSPASAATDRRPRCHASDPQFRRRSSL